MIWNAPIWVNQVLFHCIMFVMNIAAILSVVTPIIIIYIVIEELLYKKTLKDVLKGKYLISLIGSLTISVIVLGIFFLPKPVMKEKYELSALWITDYPDGINGQTISIENDQAIKEFIDIIKTYNCHRSFDSADISDVTGTLWLSTTVFMDDSVSPLFFIIRDNRCLVYTGGNVDFIYVIEDKNKQLDDQLIALFKKYGYAKQ